jgi:hypothetical protein
VRAFNHSTRKLHTLSRPSNLARSLITDKILWPYLGVTSLDESNVKEWMKQNLDRDHFS